MKDFLIKILLNLQKQIKIVEEWENNPDWKENELKRRVL